MQHNLTVECFVTSYILNSPEFTLFQFGTPTAIECNCGECSLNGPCLTSCMRIIDIKYRFVGGRGVWRTLETGISVWSENKNVAISGIPLKRTGEMGPRSSPLPNMYARNEESSNPQTP